MTHNADIHYYQCVDNAFQALYNQLYSISVISARSSHRESALGLMLGPSHVLRSLCLRHQSVVSEIEVLERTSHHLMCSLHTQQKLEGMQRDQIRSGAPDLSTEQNEFMSSLSSGANNTSTSSPEELQCSATAQSVKALLESTELL